MHVLVILQGIYLASFSCYNILSYFSVFDYLRLFGRIIAFDMHVDLRFVLAPGSLCTVTFIEWVVQQELVEKVMLLHL